MTFIAHARKSDGAEQSLTDHLQGVGSKAQIFAAKLGMLHLSQEADANTFGRAGGR
jgi:hypothetical protein